jgi:hypothetical protein
MIVLSYNSISKSLMQGVMGVPSILRDSPSGGLVQARHILLQQLPWDLSHQTGAISRVIISRASTAMLHASEGGESLQVDTQLRR